MGLSPATVALLENVITSTTATRDHFLAQRAERLNQVAEHDAELATIRALHAQVLEHSTRIRTLEAELSTITAPSNAQAPLFADRAARLRQQIADRRTALDGLTAQLADLTPLAVLQQRRDRRETFAAQLERAAGEMQAGANWAQDILNKFPE